MSRKRRPRNPDSEAPTVVDLFCGAGGLSYAFYRAGFNIIAAVEKDEDAAESYRRSFIESYSPHTELIVASISTRRVADRMRALGELGRGVDVVIGGPPCQDFSPARLKARRRGSRANLVKTYFRIIDILQPRIFVFENVPNLLKAAGGKYWTKFQAEAEAIGYDIRKQELCAEDFRVPQRRRRLFVFGSREPSLNAPLPKSTRRKPPTVMEVIGHLPHLRAGQVADDPMHRARNHREDMVRYFSKIPEGGAWRDAKRRIPCQHGHNGHYDTYGRMRGDDIAPTLTGGCTNPSKGRFIHPSQDRGLTIREAALLQTFPPTWYFHGGVESQSLQVGNAVPPKLGEVLAKQFYARLDQRGGQHTKSTPTLDK